MTRNAIKFLLSTPERTEDACPTCGMTEAQERASTVWPPTCEHAWHFAETEHELPACWAICDRCQGEGSHVNPNVDGHGITESEWNGPDWDDESREAYLDGVYDVPCEAGCVGGKVLAVDESQCTHEPRKSLLERYNAQQDEIARDRAEDRRTRYMESGGREGRSW